MGDVSWLSRVAASAHLWWYVVVVAFGLGVGATELIARYRDDPFRALRTFPAIAYILINGAASFFAYLLITAFDWSFGVSDPAQKGWLQAFVAGFGSMVFFRSSLFAIRVGQTDLSAGPGLLFQVLLFATDRQCDRDRAEPRSVQVAEIMSGVSFDQAREALPNFCFELMQNVPAAEQQQFRQVVDALASSRMRDSVKSLNLGLMLMNVVGRQVLSAAVRTLGERIQGPAKLELAVYSQLQGADFTKAFPLLVDLCFIMSKYGSPEEQKKSKQEVMDEAKPLAVNTSLENSAKMTLLGLSLQQRVGDAVLLAALVHAGDAIAVPHADNAPAPAAAGVAATELGQGATPAAAAGAGSGAEVVPLHTPP